MSNDNRLIYDLDEARSVANDVLDRMIPLRYRSAGLEHPDVKEWVAKYAQSPTEAPSLLLIGPTGSGKTWAAYGALRAAALASLVPNRTGVYVVCGWHATTYPDFLAEMRPGINKSPDGHMDFLRSVKLLMVDDLGVSKGSEFTEDCTHRLVSGRYDQMRPSIFTTNLPVEHLRSVLGDRVASRLAEQCVTIPMLDDDRRRPGSNL